MNHGITGLVTVRKNSEIVLKIWTDCGGENAADLADAIRERRGVPTVHEATVLATVSGFGCKDCQMVVAKCESVGREENVRTGILGDITSSPYVGCATAEYLEVVDL
jgi:hypothetical protein